MSEERPKCQLCGEPMPPGEEMFNFHGYSGPCPKTAFAESRQAEIEKLDADFQRHLRTDPIMLAAYQSATAANYSTTQTLKFLAVTLVAKKNELEKLLLGKAMS